MKALMSTSPKALIPVFPFHRTYRRCIFIKQKLEVYKVIRLANVLTTKVKGNKNRYAVRSLESFLLNDTYIINNDKISVFVDLINAVFLTSLVSQDVIKDKKQTDYRALLLFMKLLDLFFYRVLIPIFIEAIIHLVFHHNDKLG